MPEIHDFLDDKLFLSHKKLYLRARYLRGYLNYPFKPLNRNEKSKPEWLQVYDKIKHDRINGGFVSSNLKILIDAFGSYFVVIFYLRHYHNYLYTRFGEDFLSGVSICEDFVWKFEKDRYPFIKLSQGELSDGKMDFELLSNIKSELFTPVCLPDNDETESITESFYVCYNFKKLIKLLIDSESRYYDFFVDHYNEETFGIKSNLKLFNDKDINQMYRKLIEKPYIIIPNLPEEILGIKRFLS